MEQQERAAFWGAEAACTLASRERQGKRLKMQQNGQVKIKSGKDLLDLAIRRSLII